MRLLDIRTFSVRALGILFAFALTLTACSAAPPASALEDAATPSADAPVSEDDAAVEAASDGGDVPSVDAGCVPTTCSALRAECGVAPDGCGGVLTCGACRDGSECGGGGKPNVCGPKPCKAKTCSELGATCGDISDGCSGVLHCGSCGGFETCGGGGVPNVCGCTKRTCAAGDCGERADGCGGIQNCGACTGTATCGGAGQPNRCGGCTPKTCASEGYTCGAGSAGCGMTLNCGTCAKGSFCNGPIGQCLGYAALCGSTAVHLGSCTARDTQGNIVNCYDYADSYTVPPPASLMQACTNAGHTWSTGTCSHQGSLGGCRIGNYLPASYCSHTTYWYYPPRTSADLTNACTFNAGTILPP